MADVAPSVARVLAGLDAIKPWLEELYRDFHQHPELSNQEVNTAAAAADALRAAGYEVRERIGTTGLVGVLRNGDGPTILVRADMDALPVKEETGLPYASTATATDAAGNTVPVAHACGHDVHVTSLLGAARLLAESRSAWRGTFIALLQPAEELGTGAAGMVEAGLVDLVPKPEVALAQHVLAYRATIVLLMPTNLMLGTYQILAVVAFTLFGIGLAFYATPSTDAALANLPDDQTGSGSGIYKMASSLGASFGVAISAAIFTALSAETGPVNWIEGVIPFIGRQDNLAVREAALFAFAPTC